MDVIWEGSVTSFFGGKGADQGRVSDFFDDVRNFGGEGKGISDFFIGGLTIPE